MYILGSFRAGTLIEIASPARSLATTTQIHRSGLHPRDMHSLPSAEFHDLCANILHPLIGFFGSVVATGGRIAVVGEVTTLVGN
jgi:hypothetical protein